MWQRGGATRLPSMLLALSLLTPAAASEVPRPAVETKQETKQNTGEEQPEAVKWLRATWRARQPWDAKPVRGTHCSDVRAHAFYERPAAMGELSIGSTISLELTPGLSFDLYRFRDGSSGFRLTRTERRIDVSTTLAALVQSATGKIPPAVLSKLPSQTIIPWLKPSSQDAILSLQELGHVSKDGRYQLTLPFTGWGEGNISEHYSTAGISASHDYHAQLYLKVMGALDAKKESLRADTRREYSLWSTEGMSVHIGGFGLRIQRQELSEREDRDGLRLARDARRWSTARTRELRLDELLLSVQLSTQARVGVVLSHGEERVHQNEEERGVNIDDSIDDAVQQWDWATRQDAQRRRTRVGILLATPPRNPKHVLGAEGTLIWRSRDHYEARGQAHWLLGGLRAAAGLRVEAVPRELGPARQYESVLGLSTALLTTRHSSVRVGVTRTQWRGIDLFHAASTDDVLLSYERRGPQPFRAQLAVHHHHGAFTGATLRIRHPRIAVQLGFDTAEYAAAAGPLALDTLRYDTSTVQELVEHEVNSFLSLTVERYRIGGDLNHAASLSWHRRW